MRTLVFITALAMIALAHRADAYPQFQLAREPTCTGCHIAPDGTGLLNENGLAVAEAISWKDQHKAEFLYGVVHTPEWLQLGGDLRGAAGFVDPGFASAAGYPMQAELAARATYKAFSVYALGGFREPSDNAGWYHVLWSRQHYVMWEQNPGEGQGLYVRAGRLSPTFGLRLAEHVVYTQRYGGRPLYDEVYALAVSYVKREYEVHVTGFVHDPIDSPAWHGDGGALYAEARIGEHAALGVEGKVSSDEDDTREFGGATGKLYLPGPQLLLQAEAEYIHQHIKPGGDKRDAVAAYLLASRPLPYGLLLDVGFGHYTADTRVSGLYRDGIDVNLHWFYDAHFEFLLTNRLELLEGGAGPNGGYVLAQLHVRL